MHTVVTSNSRGPLDMALQSGKFLHGTAEHLDGLVGLSIERTSPDLEQFETGIE